MTPEAYFKEALMRAERATAGPWHIGHVREDGLDYVDIDGPDLQHVAEVYRREDQPLIASCRTDVEKLAKICQVLWDAMREIEDLEPLNERARRIIAREAIAKVQALIDDEGKAEAENTRHASVSEDECLRGFTEWEKAQHGNGIRSANLPDAFVAGCRWLKERMGVK
jgi:hypothetical protein